MVKLFDRRTHGQYFYKIGSTEKTLLKRFKGLHDEFDSCYKIELLNFYYISSEKDEKIFHNKNKHLKFNYIDLFGREKTEVYELTDDIIIKFNEYGKKFI